MLYYMHIVIRAYQTRHMQPNNFPKDVELCCTLRDYTYCMLITTQEMQAWRKDRLTNNQDKFKTNKI